MSRKPVIYLVLDPGLANTGVAVAAVSKGDIKVLYLDVITTEANTPLRERFDKIRRSVTEIIKTYGVQRTVCEAYEVRTYQGKMKSSVAMSKLINELSEEVYRLKLPFLLSSPDNKKRVRAEDIPQHILEQIKALPKYKREHCRDAVIHLVFELNIKGKP